MSVWEDGAYLRQRRNLNAMSISLLLYTLAGGSIQSGDAVQLPAGIISIHLSSPEMITYFLWSALGYFM